MNPVYSSIHFFHDFLSLATIFILFFSLLLPNPSMPSIHLFLSFSRFLLVFLLTSNILFVRTHSCLFVFYKRRKRLLISYYYSDIFVSFSTLFNFSKGCHLYCYEFILYVAKYLCRDVQFLSKKIKVNIGIHLCRYIVINFICKYTSDVFIFHINNNNRSLCVIKYNS